MPAPTTTGARRSARDYFGAVRIAFTSQKRVPGRQRPVIVPPVVVAEPARVDVGAEGEVEPARGAELPDGPGQTGRVAGPGAALSLRSGPGCQHPSPAAWPNPAPARKPSTYAVCASCPIRPQSAPLRSIQCGSGPRPATRARPGIPPPRGPATTIAPSCKQIGRGARERAPPADPSDYFFFGRPKTITASPSG